MPTFTIMFFFWVVVKLPPSRDLWRMRVRLLPWQELLLPNGVAVLCLGKRSTFTPVT